MMKKGFTLTEMTVVIAIFSLIIATVYLIFALNQRVYLAGEEMAEITQNGRVILERMTREIRQAREIVTELSDDEGGASSIIEFEDGHTTTRYYYIRYYQEDGNVKREVKRYYFSSDPCDPCTFLLWNAASPTETLEVDIVEEPVIIGEYITNLKFWGSYTINIFITLTKNDQEIDLSTRVFGRNLY